MFGQYFTLILIAVTCCMMWLIRLENWVLKSSTSLLDVHATAILLMLDWTIQKLYLSSLAWLDYRIWERKSCNSVINPGKISRVDCLCKQFYIWCHCKKFIDEPSIQLVWWVVILDFCFVDDVCINLDLPLLLSIYRYSHTLIIMNPTLLPTELHCHLLHKAALIFLSDRSKPFLYLPL